MKKLVALLGAVLLTAALSFPALAESQSMQSYRLVRGENFCTGTFENVALGALPQSGTNAELAATAGWRSNEYDYQTVSIVNKGYGGGKCLQIAGNGENPYGAAYFIFPTGKIKRGETYEVSFSYKVTDPLTKTNQLHCDAMDGGVGETHTNVAGLAPLPGDMLKDGWRRVTGSFVVESPGTFKALRFFAEFLYNGTTLGSEATLLVDNVEIGRLTTQSAGTAAVQLSERNLLAGGDFEYREVGKLYDPSFDENGWWTRDDEKMGSAVVQEGGGKALRMAGNMMLQYASVFVNFQEKMQAGKSYRLLFDYKFLGTTRQDTAQAHVSFQQDQDLQIGNPGGWGNVNLVVNDLGVTLKNGYRRVAVDFTPTAFQAESIFGLRFFINLALQPATFGILFDNVRVSELTAGGAGGGAVGGGTTTPAGSGTAVQPTTPGAPTTPGGTTVDLPDEDVSDIPLTSDPDASFTETTPEESELPPQTQRDGAPAAGWIVLIVLGCLAVLGGGGFALWYFVLRPRRSAATDAPAEEPAGEPAEEPTGEPTEEPKE